MTERLRGSIKFVAEKGYGFIIRQDGGADVFFHVRQFPQDTKLDIGQAVTFDLEAHKRGDRAVNIELE